MLRIHPHHRRRHQRRIHPGEIQILILHARTQITTQHIHRHAQHAQHRQIHAQIKNHRRGEMLPQKMPMNREQKRPLHKAQHAGKHRGHNAAPGKNHRHIHLRYPLIARIREIHQHERTTRHQRGNKPATRRIMAPPENQRTQHSQKRQHNLQQRLHRNRIQLGMPNRRRMRPPHKRVPRHRRHHRRNHNRRHAQHAQLAHGVKRAELHQNSIHHIIALGHLRAVLQIPHGQIAAIIPPHQQIRAQERHNPKAHGHHNRHAFRRRRLPMLRVEPLRLLAHHQHHNDHRQRLHQKLGERHIRGTQHQHLQCHTHAGNTNTSHRRQPLRGAHNNHNSQNNNRQRQQVGYPIRTGNPRV